MSTVIVAVLVDVLPTASEAVTVAWMAPSGSAAEGVTLQLPEASAVVVKITSATPSPLVSKATVTLLPASALPVKVGVLSLVIWFASVGAAGARVSIVRLRVVLALVLPELSVTLTVAVVVPCGKALAGVTLQ